MNKIQTYLGFCLKSGKIKIGLNNLEELKKNVFLVIYNQDVGESSLKKIIKATQRLSCELVVTKENLENYVLKECKVLAVQDKNLAKAILDNLDENFIICRRSYNG